jgi:hypothetical protein
MKPGDIRVDLRKISKEDRKPLKEFWDSLSSEQRRLVGVMMNYTEQSERDFNRKYKDYR